MDRCDPVEMRKNLVVVGAFKRAGINFVAIPAMNESDKAALIGMMRRRLAVYADTNGQLCLTRKRIYPDEYPRPK